MTNLLYRTGRLLIGTVQVFYQLGTWPSSFSLSLVHVETTACGSSSAQGTRWALDSADQVGIEAPRIAGPSAFMTARLIGVSSTLSARSPASPCSLTRFAR